MAIGKHLRHPIRGLKILWAVISGNRTIAVLAGIGLLAVPTAFTVCPGLVHRISHNGRVAILAVWLVVAGIATLATRFESERAQKVAKGSYRVLLKSYLARQFALLPAGYESTLYIPDDQLGVLLPFYPRRINDVNNPHVFRYDQGATGAAYTRKRPSMAVGEGVSSPEFNLTPAQHSLFANDEVVVAVPVFNEDAQVIGVLSLLGHQNDSYYVSPNRVPNKSNIEALEGVADEIGLTLATEGVT